MLSMWKRCTKSAFIDTRHNHPSQGIALLLKNPSEVEGVRNAFRTLFSEETDDVEKKWDHILTFMEYINGRLADLFPNSSIYLQTREGVLTYLNLWDPDHNYRYKPRPANNWASYIGYADWETGQRFSLRKYYKICDEIREVVKNHQELLCIHRQRFENGEPDYDKKLHILTFDVLYCFWGYEDAQIEAHEEYQEVINEYRSAYDNFELYQEDSSAFMENYPLVNVNALIEPYLSSIDLTFFSAIKDINGDNVDELIVGVDAEHPNSIYTFYGGQIIPLINDIGERSYINIYDDGTIYRHDSGGASFSIDTIYEINESGDGLSTIKQFEADWDRDPDYPYYDGAESLSQEQFNAEYLDKNEMEFNWSK